MKVSITSRSCPPLAYEWAAQDLPLNGSAVLEYGYEILATTGGKEAGVEVFNSGEHRKVLVREQDGGLTRVLDGFYPAPDLSQPASAIISILVTDIVHVGGSMKMGPSLQKPRGEKLWSS